MSGIICTCDAPVKHLGMPGCTDSIGILLRMILVPTYKNDGTLNYVDTTSTIDTAAFWNNLQYNTDETARYYPLSVNLEEVAANKGESVMQEFASGRKYHVRDGVRDFSAQAVDLPAKMVGKIKSKGCSKFSAFFVDNNGALVGQEKSLGLLYPLQIADNTLNAYYAFATDTTLPITMISWQFDVSVLDEQLAIINASDIGVDLLTQFNGKIDTNIAQVAANRSTTTFMVDIYNDYGTAKTKLPVEGLVTADFTIYNVTDAGALTLTSATESTTVPGRYAMVISAAQTATDIIRLGLSTTDAAKPFDAGTWADVQIALQ